MLFLAQGSIEGDGSAPTCYCSGPLVLQPQEPAGIFCPPQRVGPQVVTNTQQISSNNVEAVSVEFAHHSGVPAPLAA